MILSQQFDAALTTLEIQSRSPDLDNAPKRQHFCNETLQELNALTIPQNYHLPNRPQALMFTQSKHFFAACINFAFNDRLTWIEFEYQPLALMPIAWEIFFDDLMAWDVGPQGRYLAKVEPPKSWDIVLRGKHLTKVEVPEFKADGWKDAELSPSENARKILSTIERIADEVDATADFSDFISGSRHASLYRVAQASSLILEGKVQQARDLAEKLRNGEMKQAGLEWYSLAHGKRLPVGDLVSRFLDGSQKI